MASSESLSSGTSSGASKATSMLKGIHGVGEQIRGTFNKGVDDVAAESFGNDTTKNHHLNDAKNTATLQKGENEIKNGEAAFRASSNSGSTTTGTTSSTKY